MIKETNDPEKHTFVTETVVHTQHTYWSRHSICKSRRCYPRAQYGKRTLVLKRV